MTARRLGAIAQVAAVMMLLGGLPAPRARRATRDEEDLEPEQRPAPEGTATAVVDLPGHDAPMMIRVPGRVELVELSFRYGATPTPPPREPPPSREQRRRMRQQQRAAAKRAARGGG